MSARINVKPWNKGYIIPLFFTLRLSRLVPPFCCSACRLYFCPVLQCNNVSYYMEESVFLGTKPVVSGVMSSMEWESEDSERFHFLSISLIYGSVAK